MAGRASSLQSRRISLVARTHWVESPSFSPPSKTAITSSNFIVFLLSVRGLVAPNPLRCKRCVLPTNEHPATNQTGVPFLEQISSTNTYAVKNLTSNTKSFILRKSFLNKNSTNAGCRLCAFLSYKAPIVCNPFLPSNAPI